MPPEQANTERRFTIDLAWSKVVDARFTELIVARGLRAFVNRIWATSGGGPDPLPGTVLIHQSHAFGMENWLLDFGDDGMAFVERSRDEVRVRVGAVSDALAYRLVQQFHEALPERLPAAAAVSAMFWAKGEHGYQGVMRKLVAPGWPEIVTNYPEATAAVLAPLFDEPWRPTGGRLLLWHGETGTGKTHAVRALMHAWRNWCGFHVIVDPEKFLGTDSEYMLDVLGYEPESGDPEANGTPRPAWRLLVMEDSGELIALDAANRTGQGLSRLLNLCDGLLGQSYNTLVLITTNEELGRLHPAIARPGRCLANVEFEPFGSMAAARWLMEHGVTDIPNSMPTASLADLYARLDGRRIAIPRGPVVGFVTA